MRRVARHLLVGGGLALVAAFASVAGAQVLPPGTDSDCSGQVPVVVGSDEAAQSDLYSAVTLVGVLDTTCVVLAGPRDEAMAAAQQVRLTAATGSGWVVGGTVAVPDAKIADFRLTRLGGIDRWHTARLVGAIAADRTADIHELTTQTAAATGDDDGTTVTVNGTEVRLPPGINSDCSGQVPVVVAADATAQSDLYSAVTLAGALDTTCIVLAGARDAPMDAAQLARLQAASGGGWIVGGTIAVPDEKVDDHNLTRVGGTDRWDTATQIGQVTNIVTDDDITPDDIEAAITRTTNPNTYTHITAGVGHSCALRADQTAVCWGGNNAGQRDTHSEVPAGTYTAITAGGAHSCALRTDDTLACWFTPDWRAAPSDVELIYGPNVKLAT